ncbi:hypothetical protein ABZS66_00940 [Dactylosporangium sp. NPDC005572]|uniref:hypothetical protein n=1 Tax=Dactylosporangium sp. NPDC005572 TaxID=3156889 RepID=UPI0033B9D9BD
MGDEVKMPYGEAEWTGTFDLPNPQRAIDLIEQQEGVSLGSWDFNNSCLTWCADVLHAGGSTVPGGLSGAIGLARQMGSAYDGVLRNFGFL